MWLRGRWGSSRTLLKKHSFHFLSSNIKWVVESACVISILAALLFFSNPLAGQTALSGRVIDLDQQPVETATIFIQETGQLLEADKAGRFELPALSEEKVTLTVFAEGYTTQVLKVNTRKKGVLEIAISPLSIDIETVEVQVAADNYGLRRLRNVEGTAIYAAKKSEVIELDNLLGNLAANNAREVYKGVAGLNVWENDGGGLQLAIGARGLDPNRTSNFNTRQNGYDISADALGYPESYYTPPAQALQRIEIVRGAASLQYGTQFGGLLNFVFKKGPEGKPFEFTSENTYGSFGLFNTFNSIGGAKGRANYYGFYQYKQGDGWRPNSGFSQHAAYGNVNVKATEKLDIGLEYTHMNYLAQQAGGLVDFEFEMNPRQSKRERNWFKVGWNLAALTLDYRLSDRTRFNLRNFLLIAGRDALGELGPINRPDPGRERDLIAGQYRNFGAEARMLHRYSLRGQSSTFLLGARFYRGLTRNRQGDANDGSGPDFQFLNPNDLERSDYEFPSRNLALFAENLFTLSPRLTLTPGVRLEYIRTASDGYYKQRVFSGGQVIFEQRLEDDQVNERSFLLMGLGLGYQLKQGLEAYANFSQNYRAINFSDLAVVNPNLVVDSLLQDERGYNTDIGLRGTLLEERLRFDLSAFYLRYNGRIGLSEITVPDPIAIERQVAYRTNIGDARILGLEAYAEADLWRLAFGAKAIPSLSLFVNLSHLKGEYVSGQRQFVGNEVELIPPISVKTGLSFRLKGLRLSCLYTYVRRHYSDATNAEFVANATRGIIPSYGVMDASASYDFSRFRLQAGVNNLMDAAYFTRRATGYPGPGIIPAEGRRFYVGVRVRI
ncbi:MAG: TonB-dependent receptor [Lewinellaceae bacterium]|nr:TonB-dependent receptor [Phaeodactylibacter sp.]MCB9041324.1 TonB-dependent receptor [Lewinellaceae bacterium]